MLSFNNFFILLEKNLSFRGDKAKGHAEYVKSSTSVTSGRPIKIGNTLHPEGTKLKVHKTEEVQGPKGIEYYSYVSVGRSKKKVRIPHSHIKKPPGQDYNHPMAQAFEAATAIKLHEMHGLTGPEHTKKLKELNNVYKDNIKKLPFFYRNQVNKRAENAAIAFNESIREKGKVVEINHITKKTPITRVSSKVPGGDQANPHDIHVKFESGEETGASLKFSSKGTISNNSTSSIDKKNHFDDKLNLSQYISDTNAMAKHHAETFESGTLEQKKKHLHYLLKSNPDIDYYYVDAEKGTSTSHKEMPHYSAIENANSFITKMSRSGASLHIYDQDGNHITTIEHRSKHGSGSKPEVLAKLGSIKQKSKEETPKSPVSKKKPVPDGFGRIDHGHVITNAPF